MSIPKMTQDVEIIQKLSDLPNSSDGLTAQELKAKFDEAARLVKEFVNNELIPAIAAKNIPFDKSVDVDADTVQAAILKVQQNMRDIAAGSIVNGSVSKEKLSAELMARVYGGRPWVSMKTPDIGDNVAKDFPIGQVWLRPAFDVVNARTTNWSAIGCTVTAVAQKVTMTGNKTVATASMTQSLTGIGQADDTIHILFDVTEKDPEITNMTISVNGGAAQDIGDSVSVTTQLAGDGALILEINATWPAISLAGGNLVVENLAIVNVSQIQRQLTEGQAIPDWAAYLRNLLPLESYHSPAEVYLQVTDGNWWPMGFEVLPVSRGGTGLDRYTKGQMLYADSEHSMKPLDPATASNSFLLYGNGSPKWETTEQVSGILGTLKLTSGSYAGNGAARTVTLPVSPKLLYLYSAGGTVVLSDTNCRSVADLPVVLTSGAVGTGLSYRDGYFGATSVKLSGNALTFSQTLYSTNAKDWYMNRSGVTYNWVALY